MLRSLSGQASLVEAYFGVLWVGATVLAVILAGFGFALGGESLSPLTALTLSSLMGVYLLVGAVGVWRCAFNTRYWGVGVGARVIALCYGLAVTYAFYVEATFASQPMP
ncbi:hypothetical protein [Pseudomarimonas arenosa]|uniref:Uncharacterized protein n=1 Tax=Pseudomarimonas arenosa TaxID=2774145 RepID=A0AAW3ZKS0_9GAMM|nr:hypothetical protein [Pseudomarimonas arenosa]MBD8526040.1 hypothetical protein [Pseudomarimonas arenosa]